jgi:hypothetical protein
LVYLHTLLFHKVSVHYYGLAPTRNTCVTCRYHALSCSRSQILATRFMELSFTSFGSRHSLPPVTNGASADRRISISIAETFVDTSHWFVFGNKEFYHSTFFVTHAIDRLHFEELLQRCYLSGNFTTSYTTAGNFKFASPKTSPSIVTGKKQKKRGHYFLGNPLKTISSCVLILVEAFFEPAVSHLSPNTKIYQC